MQETYINQPKFHVAVDCVIFGYEDDELKLLLYPRRFEPFINQWSLMGGFVQEKESLEEAVRRILEITVGLNDIYLELLNNYSEPNRDPGGRVVSMAYYALIRINEHDKHKVEQHGGKWYSITNLPDLVFDHNAMVNDALEKLRIKASYQVIGKELLPELFTLTQLNNLYNVIFQKKFDQGNFRKKILALNILTRTSEKETNSSRRGSFLYKFKKK